MSAACLRDADCPATGSVCIERLCEGGQCMTRNVPEGDEADQQTAGDCAIVQCDGNGGTRAIADDDDLPPVEETPCAIESCEDGELEVEFADEGDGCNDGASVCDGEGHCIECNVAGDCPGKDGACAMRTCEERECGMAYTPAGTDLPDDIEGDCEALECDGRGVASHVTDASDVPAAPSDCVIYACENGGPVERPAERGAACDENGGARCDGNGACVECTESAQCPPNGVCKLGLCVVSACNDTLHNGDETDTDCGGSCPKCAAGKMCSGSADCSSSVCNTGRCAVGECGDGVITPPELCDDHNEVNGDGCDNDCRPSCGNGVRNGLEVCDDGDFASGDGCSATCQIEPYYQCRAMFPSVCTRQEGICSGGANEDGDAMADGADPDCNLRGVVPDCSANQTFYQFNSVRVPVAVPDESTITNDIRVPAIGTVRRVVLRVSIMHPWVEDLDILLTSPDGTTRIAATGVGEDGMNFTNTRFRDGAARAITGELAAAPFTGEFKPEEAFTAFNGEVAAGVWRLTVADVLSDDMGTLTSYSLGICAN